jgi:hypothetical protein
VTHQYKTAVLSLISSTLSLVIYFLIPHFSYTVFLQVFCCLVLTAYAMLAAFQCIRAKQTQWIGYLLFLIAAVTFVFQFPGYFLLFVFGH